MSEKDFKIAWVDNGFCRVVYVALNADGKKVYYCLQDEGGAYGGVICYRCTEFDGEPEYPITYSSARFEVPTGDTITEKNVRDYLTGDIKA